jgi:hypothetical protein
MKTMSRAAFVALPMACLALPALLAGTHLVSAQPAPKQDAADAAPPIKQMALTEKQVTGVLAAQKDIDAVTDKIPESDAGKPDAKIQTQLDSVAKKYGFSSFAEYSDVTDNISLVLSGIDPKTKAFTQPPEVLKKQLAAMQSDTKMPPADKKAALEDMNAALKSTPDVQFPDNVTLVTKYYDKLAVALQEDQ